jgi:AraC-like DNA-binding protein
MYHKNNTFYCLIPEWQGLIANEIGAEFLDNKIIIVPEKLGYGHVFFIEVIPGISLLLFDFVLSRPYEIFRIKNDIERYIIHLDLSESTNVLKVGDIEHEIGHCKHLGLTVIENQIESSFLPNTKERTFVLRLFVDKKLMDKLIKDSCNKEQINNKITSNKRPLFYSEDMNSNTVLLISSIKEKSVFNQSFDPFIKGIGLKLLSDFLNNLTNPKNTNFEIPTLESDRLNNAKNYLLNNLTNPFPSLLTLSKIAGMSSSKFKLLFKKKFLCTPNDLFIREKMVFANALLQSGNFTSLTEIIHELNYTKLDYFSLKYFEVYHRKPSEDFIKKDSLKK